MEETLKELYYSAEDTGSYGGVERLYFRAVEAQVPGVTRDAIRDFFYPGSGPIFHTNPQGATFHATASMSGK